MKNITIFLIGFFIFNNLQAQKNYYISAAGDDNNNGLSEDAPFKTIARLNALILSPGDKLLFKSGDVFWGQLNINQSGESNKAITVGCYGEGDEPVINGSTALHYWTKYSRNIWVTTCPQCRETVTGVYLNKKALKLGRYPNLDDPNDGYLTVSSHSGKSILQSNDLDGKNWAGAEVVYHPQQWIFDKAKILNENGNTLTLRPDASYEIADKWGFFIQKSLATLDEEGEWYFDSTNKQVYVYLSDTDPNKQTVEVTTINAGININNASYVTIENIQILQNLHYAIFAKGNCSNLVIKNVTIKNCGENGISILGQGSDIQILNNNISFLNNIAVEVLGPKNFTMAGNHIKNVSLVAGMSKSKNLQCMAVYYKNDQRDQGSALIENNTMDSLGFIGIRFESSNIIIQRNVISNVNLIQCDGGGIYTFNATKVNNKFVSQYSYHDQKIQNNIVYNVFGTTKGAFGWAKTDPSAYGIYIDDCSMNVDILNNTIFNCATAGIFVHSSSGVNIMNNTLYDNTEGVFIQENTCGVQNNNVQGNVFFLKKDNQMAGRFAVYSPAAFAKFSGNSYIYTENNRSPIQMRDITNTVNKNFVSMSGDDWKRSANKDLDAKILKVNMAQINSERVLFRYNPSNQAQEVRLNGTYKDLKNNIYQGSVTIQPFSSVILLK